MDIYRAAIADVSTAITFCDEGCIDRHSAAGSIFEGVGIEESERRETRVPPAGVCSKQDGDAHV